MTAAYALTSNAERSLPAIVVSTTAARKRTTYNVPFLPSRNSARRSNEYATMNALFMIRHEFIIPAISTL